MFLIMLALIVFTILFAEMKHFAPAYIFTFMLFLLTGSMLFSEGIITDYPNIITENYANDSNKTYVAIDTNKPVTITVSTDTGINYLANFFTYGSFLFLAFFVFRQDSFSREDIYKRHGL